jgi:hypothetical protein
MITGRQILAARALLGLSQEELADLARLSPLVLQDIEAVCEMSADHETALQRLKEALETAGIAFIDERTTSSAGGVGVRLAAPHSASVDTNSQETVQYPEMVENGPFGAGG